MIKMVDRVARALAKAADDDYVTHMEFWQLYARAAIEAMRTPTDAMEYAGATVADNIANVEAEACWQAMIDAALADPIEQREEI